MKTKKYEEDEVELEDDFDASGDSDADEEPAPKKKTAKAKVEEEDEETPRKKTAKATTKKAVKREPAEPRTRPYREGSLIGTLFAKLEKGMSRKHADAWIEQNKTSKKGGAWLLPFIRREEANGFKWNFEDENGFLKISNVRKIAAKKAA